MSEDNAAKLSDFSVSIPAPEGKEVAESTDVYTFGMLFLEVLTGKRFVFETGGDSDVEIHIRDWVSKGLGHKCISEILDPAITGVRLTVNEELKQQLRASIKLALRCTAAEDHRPTMDYGE
uniref:Protein kinase domain-containing protein n=1 Tax=Chenopodium quinoa TaxID=63459 RepID=A0A803M6D7_CHEQI